MNTYNHHLGDYGKDTRDLSPLEHGVYRLLLDFNYATEHPIPNEFEKLYRIVGALKPAECMAVRLVAERFFPVNGDGRRHNKRADAEIQKYLERVEHNRKVGALGGRPRKNPEEIPDETRTDMPRETRTDTRHEPDGNPNQEPKPERTKASPANAGEVRGGAANVPNCPHEKLVELYHEVLPTCTLVVEWNDERQGIARARWRQKATAKPGYRTVEDGLAYWRRYFEYVARSKFLTGKAEPTPGRKPFVATLEWLLRPKNFAKVVEGNYHEEKELER